MNLSFWPRGWQISGTAFKAVKRSPRPQPGWGTQAETLEQRALLSAVMDHGVDSNTVAEVSSARARQASPYPNLNGTFSLSGTNGTVVTGSVTFVQPSSEELTGTVNINGLPAAAIEVHRTGNRITLEVKPTVGENVTVKGRFNRDHDEIKIRTVTRDAQNARVVTNATIKFDSNATPSTFTLTINSSNGLAATVVGTKLRTL